MTDSPPEDTALGQRRVYSRPPVDGTDKEIDAWADAFVEDVLGPLNKCAATGGP